MEPARDTTESLEPHILERFQVVQKVGSGAYGHVWKVQHIKSGHFYALKKIFDAFQNVTDAQRTFREVCVLRQLRHDSIIRLVDTLRAENGLDVYLVFEYVESDLHSVVRQNLLHLPHQKFVMAQLARAMLYIHSAELLHRDLKPSNILINEDCEIKVCDFGLVKFLKSLGCDRNVLTEHVATRWYRSPEMLLGCADYGKPTDIWSMGCILAEMLLRRPLFPGNSNLDQLERVLSFTGRPKKDELQSFRVDNLQTLLDTLDLKLLNVKEMFRDCDPLAVDMLMRMLQLVPEKRITASEMLAHPFLDKFRAPELDICSLEPIECPINDNKKLSIREYRNLVHEPIIKQESRLKLKEVICRRSTHNRSKANLPEPRSSNESKSDWQSPYLRENSFVRRSPHRRKVLAQPLKEILNSQEAPPLKPNNSSHSKSPANRLPSKPNNTIHISSHGKSAVNIYRAVMSVAASQPQSTSATSKHLIRKRRYRKDQHRQEPAQQHQP